LRKNVEYPDINISLLAFNRKERFVGIDWVNILAIIISPVIAVVITLWHQGRKEKRDRKERLFTQLMAHRKSFPPSTEFVNALNLIDIIFADTVSVTKLWHEYYTLLGSAKTEHEYRDRDHKYLELLSEMARSLGYKRLQQTDIDKFYTPQAHVDQNEMAFHTQQEWLRVLKNMNYIYIEPKQKDEASQ
jgi:hypothetical protein